MVYRYCSICGSCEHTKRTCPRRQTGRNKCSVCGEPGHNKRTCPKSQSGRVKYKAWQSSYSKWDRDIWELLRTTMREHAMKASTTKNREEVWLVLLGHRCGYCDKYMDENLLVEVGYGMTMRNKCLKCPLHHNHACSSTLNDNHLIGRMYKYWVSGHYKDYFEDVRKQLLHELRRTRFAD